MQFQNWQAVQAYKKGVKSGRGDVVAISKGLQESLLYYYGRMRSREILDLYWKNPLRIIIFIQREKPNLQMTETTLNKRQLYKNQKLQETDEIFYCQCGKNYLTFSALYLHARNKHNYKFTTKRSPEVCKVESIQDKSIVTYFLSPQTNTQSQAQPLIENSPSQKQNQDGPAPSYLLQLQLLQLYLDQHRAQLNLAELQILAHFKTYLQKLDQLLQDQEIDEVYEATLCFNDFSVYYLPYCCSTLLEFPEHMFYLQNCLVKYWFWLKRNNHTQCQLLTRSPSLKSPLS